MYKKKNAQYLVIRKTQVQTTGRYYLTPSDGYNQTLGNSKCWLGCGELEASRRLMGT